VGARLRARSTHIRIRSTEPSVTETAGMEIELGGAHPAASRIVVR
jgi:hypothetical protein